MRAKLKPFTLPRTLGLLSGVALALAACRAPVAEPQLAHVSPASRQSAPSACRAAGEVVARGGFGAGPGEFGLGPIDEHEPALAFDVSRDQRSVFVLDARSARVVIFERSQPTRTVALGHVYAEDVMAVGDGMLGVLNTSEELFSVVGQDGLKAIADRALPGLFENADDAGALYRRPDGIWVSASTNFVHVTDANGRVPDATAPLPPVPFHTAEAVAGAVHLIERAGPPAHAAVRTTELRYDSAVSRVFGLDFDRDGNRYITTAHDGAGSTLASRRIVTILSPSAAVLRRLELHPSTTAYRTRRPVSVAPDGTIYQIATDATGVVVRRFAWKNGADICAEAGEAP